MNVKSNSTNEQKNIWNGDAGNAWVETQQLVEHMFKPIENLLLGELQSSVRPRVLDVGCGTGSTTLAVSRQLGAQALCVGIDISQQMIAAAQASAKKQDLTPSFICGDAQTYTFAAASFDLIISRFGVMFFDDSIVAFKNLRYAASEQGECRFIAWRSADENPFMTTAERAAKALLPQLPARQEDEPGQFAFARRERIVDILQQSGWNGIEIEAVDIVCSFAEQDLLLYLSRMGPLGRILSQQDEQTRKQVTELVRDAFEAYVHGDKVVFTAACWKVSARV
ncbi:class I SAM-dependent methyltransferase [Herminiimonas arsenitoxidans]|uniref:class I SAM-dependent methyltransferase n=1 Tax=Herminiimonas arsenitoxidans TaxID=1809410 RepID=UPI00097080F3|nr:methyltransferase domain-containing protein [Herminiimonas arsenitoxidans]